MNSNKCNIIVIVIFLLQIYINAYLYSNYWSRYMGFIPYQYFVKSLPNRELFQSHIRKSRKSGPMPSLSISNPIDVLRREMFLEISRRKLREKQKQILLNRQMLNYIGK